MVRNRNRSQIPEFSSSDPAGWFQCVEGIFNQQKELKYIGRYIVISHVIPDVYLDEINAVDYGNATEESYERTKQELISHLVHEEMKKTKKLLKEEEMDDDSPSEFLSRLQKVAGHQACEAQIRIIWQNRLPKFIKTVIEGCCLTLNETAEVADFVYAGMTHGEAPKDLVYIGELFLEKCKSYAEETIVGDPCWYHKTFKENAHRCQPPCSWEHLTRI